MTSTKTVRGQQTPRRRSGSRLSRRANRGGSMVEFAIMAPILVVLILWANYFWEISIVRIKSAEVARYIAFERTMRSNLGAIKSEAQDRYRDLNGATKGVATAPGMQNQITLAVNASLKRAPLSGSISQANSEGGNKASGFMSNISSMMGDSVEKIIGLLGFDMNQGAVQSDVTMTVKNRIIPRQIASYMAGGGTALDLTFKDSFFVYHDTWRAWGEGLQPRQTYAQVQRITQERVRKDLAYLGLADKASGVLGPAQSFLEPLGLEIPLSPQYINDSVYITYARSISGKNARGRYNTMYNRETRTVPGDVLQAHYWINDTQACFGRRNGNSCRGREPLDIQKKRGTVNSSGDEANWPYRAFNCRGDFFQGAKKSKDPEVVYSTGGDKTYFNYGPTACQD